MPAVAAHDPLAAGSLLRSGLDLLRAYPVVLLLPLLILGAVFNGSTSALAPDSTAFEKQMRDGPPERMVSTLLAFAVTMLVFGLVAALFALVVQGTAWLVTVRAALTNLETRSAPVFGDAFRAVAPRLLPSLLTLLLWGVLLVLGFVALLVPGFILLAGWFPLVAVVVAEGRTGMAALRRTWELTRGRKRVLFLVFLAGVGVSILAGLLVSWIPVAGDTLSGAASGAVAAWWAATVAVFYHRARGAPPLA